jgi:hypothetical protein
MLFPSVRPTTLAKSDATPPSFPFLHSRSTPTKRVRLLTGSDNPFGTNLPGTDGGIPSNLVEGNEEGDDDDDDELEAANVCGNPRVPQSVRLCKGCQKTRPSACYSKAQWKGKSATQSRCIDCVEKMLAAAKKAKGSKVPAVQTSVPSPGPSPSSATRSASLSAAHLLAVGNGETQGAESSLQMGDLDLTESGTEGTDESGAAAAAHTSSPTRQQCIECLQLKCLYEFPATSPRFTLRSQSADHTHGRCKLCKKGGGHGGADSATKKKNVAGVVPDRVHPLQHEIDVASLDDHGNFCVTAHAVAAANARQPDRMMEQKKFSDARRNSAWYEQIISHRRYCGVGMQDLKDGQCSVSVRTDPPLSVAVSLLCPVALGKCLVVCTAIMSLVVDGALMHPMLGVQSSR